MIVGLRLEEIDSSQIVSNENKSVKERKRNDMKPKAYALKTTTTDEK